MNALHALLEKSLEEAAQLSRRTTGELAMELCSRLTPGTAIRVTTKGVRVTHSRYMDRLSTATAVDHALLLGLG